MVPQTAASFVDVPQVSRQNRRIDRHHSRRHSRRHSEVHRSDRSGWLRAMILGANDGILSTGALLLGVVGAGANRQEVLTAGLAGLVAGAGSMGIGEYVSVSSQRDAEEADRAIEERELKADPHGEHAELQGIYERRGLSAELASQVATQLMRTDALGAHLRDELGLTENTRARPVQAAWSSFLSFTVGALLPLCALALSGESVEAAVLVVATLLALVALGAVGARLGGADVSRGALRVGVGGAAALSLTYGVGRLVGIAV